MAAIMKILFNPIFKLMYDPRPHISAFGITLMVMTVSCFFAGMVFAGVYTISAIFWIGANVSFWLAIALLLTMMFLLVYIVVWFDVRRQSGGSHG